MNWRFPAWYPLVPREVIAARLARAAAICAEQGLAGLLLTQAVDVYYLSGTMQQGVLLLEPSGQARLFARRHPGRAAAESPLPVTPVKGLTQVALAIQDLAMAGSRLGLCLDVLSARDFLTWQSRLPGVRLVDVSGPLLEQRGVKDAFEIAAMTRAGQLAARVYESLAGLIRPGVTEAWLAGQLQALAAAQGHVALLRSRAGFMEIPPSHLVSGPEGSLPSAMDSPYSGYGLCPAFPLGAGLKTLAPHEPVVVDVGICLDGYQVDQTRTFCIGAPPHAVAKAHAGLEAVQAALLEAMLPGALSADLYDLAQEVAARQGIAEVFLGREGQRIRFVAHGVGLEIGTPPYLMAGGKNRVRAGEVYALELKAVLEQGPVGLENTVLVNPQGPPTLLTPLPDCLRELPL